MNYAELAVTTNFSFLHGASHPEEMFKQAFALNHAGIGIADRNSVAGVVRAHVAWNDTGARKAGFKLAVGARLVFADGTPDIIAYPENRAGWGQLCRILSAGKLRAKKGECDLTLEDLRTHARDLLLIAMPPPFPGETFEQWLVSLRKIASGRIWLAACMTGSGRDRRRLAGLTTIAMRVGVPLLAVNDVLYHVPERRALQDVLTCVREKKTIETAGRLLEANADRHLKPAKEMARLFRDSPQAIAETARVLERIRFTLDEIGHIYPDEPVPPGFTPQAYLEHLTWAAMRERYSDDLGEDIRRDVFKELALIERLEYAPYFLTVYDIMRFARSRGILCQGRGSAANSAVCFMLGITAVDPNEIDLLFERFISTERQEPPDIDADFEHERREEVIQYVYKRYGRDKAGIAATVIRYRPRSAIRDVGKALGLTEDVTAALARTVWGSWGDGIPDKQIRQAGLNPENKMILHAVQLATELIGFPRHLSQHVGGFVLTRDRLDETVPIGNAAMKDRTFIEWDKDDLDALRLLKVDVLALGMLTCIRKAFDLIRLHTKRTFDLANVPRKDKATYEMLQRGDSLGTFQVESRAQMNMLPRLRPEKFYDLVIQVAIVRPGPIQGDMVHPYLRRRQRKEEVTYPSPSPAHGNKDELERVLRKTLGVPLFQEQAMRIAIDAAKFTPEEANRLRRAMATFRHMGNVHEFFDQFVNGMTRRGYDREFALKCFKQIEGFGSYGFPESHAAAFAHLVYISSWLKCHHPAAFAAALLNSQPMGFYAPAQIVRDAREHGVDVLPADVNESDWDCTLERTRSGSLAMRLGFRQIDGFSEDWAGSIRVNRGTGYPALEELMRRTGLPRKASQLLADADAFRSIGLDRREALWAVRRLPDHAPLPLFAAADARELSAEADMQLPHMQLSEHVIADYQTTRLSLKGHPMQFLRGMLEKEHVLSCVQLAGRAHGERARNAGVVLVRQRPGSASGVIFMTLEDETGIANIVVWPKLFERFRGEVMGARLLLVEGEVQKSPEGVLHLVAQRMEDRTHELCRLSDMLQTLVDENAPRGEQAARHPRNVRVIPGSRDFH